MLRHIHNPDRGASFTEYTAVILLVAAIAAAVLAASLPGTVRDNIQAAIESIENEEGLDVDTKPYDPGEDHGVPDGNGELPEEARPEDREPADETAWPYTIQPAHHSESDSDSEALAGEVDPEDSPVYDEPGEYPQMNDYHESQEDFESIGDGHQPLCGWPLEDPDLMNEDTGRHLCDTLMDVDTMITGARAGCWAHPGYWGKDEEWANCQPNAADMLEHYMSASGEDIEIDMDEFVDDIPEFQEEIETQQQYIVDGALESAEGIDEPVTFPVSTEKTGWGYPPGEENGSEFVYDNRDWQSSIGSFHYWLDGEITVYPPDDPDGEPTYSLDTDVNLEKWYSWERDTHEQLFQSWKGMLAGQAHSDMAMLHQYGIAQEFWIRGDTSLPTVEG